MNPQFSPDELRRLRITLDVRNITSFTTFKNEPKTLVCEVDGDRLVLEAPSRSCTVRHLLLVCMGLEIRETGFHRQISFTARVDEVQPAGLGTDRIQATLLQYEQRVWDEFLDVFLERQNRVDAYVEAVRGVSPRVGHSSQIHAHELEEARKSLASRKLLLVDPSETSLIQLTRALGGIGVPENRVLKALTLEMALDKLKTDQPDMILCEYSLGRSCGLDLLHESRKIQGAKAPSFILVTENTTLAAVSRAAEDDIDGVVVKPLAPEQLRRAVLSVNSLRVNPPPYMAEIRTGEQMLESGDIDGAELHFRSALKKDFRPALACYYLGQVGILRKDLATAEAHFKEGLRFNRVHYKCLNGKFQLLMNQKRHEEAYEVIHRMSRFYPVNSDRLRSMLRLAVVTHRYDDVERCYSLFCGIHERDQSLVDHVCAALVVCGKRYLRTQNRARGLDLLEKAAIVGLERVKILFAVVRALLEQHLAADARKYLRRFPEEVRSTRDYQVLELEVDDLTLDHDVIVARAKSLVARGAADEKVFEILIRRLIEERRIAEARTVLATANQRLGGSTAQLESLMQGGKGASAVARVLSTAPAPSMAASLAGGLGRS